MDKFMKSRKANLTLRIIFLTLMVFALVLFILSSEKSFSGYVFSKGTTSSGIVTVADSAGKLTTKTSFNLATVNKPTLGLLYGAQSTLKISLGISLVALIGGLAQVVKLFNPKFVNKNFANSLVNLIAIAISVGFSSSLWILIVQILALMIALLIFAQAITKVKGQEVAGIKKTTKEEKNIKAEKTVKTAKTNVKVKTTAKAVKI